MWTSFSFCLILGVLSEVGAFAPLTGANLRSASTLKVMPDVDLEPLPIAYGEESRKFRRTIFTHDDWVTFRSPDRFVKNLVAVGASGVYKNMFREILATMGVATVIMVWNMAVGDYVDLDGVKQSGPLKDTVLPIMSLPMAPFTLVSSSLGLLLTFRANTSYKRWDEARKNWGMNINHTRDLIRMGNAFYDTRNASPQERQKDLERLALCTWAFVRAMKRQLSPPEEDEEDFVKEMYEKLPRRQAENIIAAAHRPNRALQDLSAAIEAMPMSFVRKLEIHKAVSIFEDTLGSSERILNSPIPRFYTRHTARFLSFWLLLLPLSLWEPFKGTWNHFAMVPCMAAISLFLFGIEELATQLEEPFTLLPMQAYCDRIYNWCTEIVTWLPDDGGYSRMLGDPYGSINGWNRGGGPVGPEPNGTNGDSGQQQPGGWGQISARPW